MSRELVGYIAVDAGCVMVGDPCYTQGQDATEASESWQSFLAATWPNVFGEGAQHGAQMAKVAPALGHEWVGIVVESGWGDGTYPVYVTYKDGRVSSVTVEFMEDE